MRLYFAYGSNMDPEQMSTRCPDSDFCGVAWLSSYRFRINSRGVATVVPEEGAIVHGALWMISTRDEGRLDKYEGVAQGIYSKHLLDLQKDKAVPFQALVYLAAVTNPGSPLSGYLEKVVAGARQCGLPENYVAAELLQRTKA